MIILSEKNYVLEWWELNKAALNDRWEKSRLGLPLEKIEPLK